MPTEDVVIGRPHVALHRYVDRYVGYRIDGCPPGMHRGLPTRRLTFIVQLDAPAAFIAGLHASAVLLPHDGTHHGIAVELTVRGARAVLAIPCGALTDCVAELSDLLGPNTRTLPERLAACNSWEGRFGILDELLLSALDPSREPAPEVVHAWEMLTTPSHSTRVEALAKEVGWSRRHLSEMFGREVGLPPRQLARVIRFERSCQLVRSDVRTTMTNIAITAGYFDHAHMLHEWHALAGCRPDQWLSEELLSVQANADSLT